MTRKTVDRALLLLIEKRAVTVERWHGGVSTYTVHRIPPGTRVSQGVDMGVHGGVDTGVAQKKTQLEEDPTSKSVRFPKEQTQPMYAVFVDLFGTPVGSMQAAFGKTVNDALAAGIVPKEVGPAARRYRERWPSVACTPMALVKHWNTFGPEAHRLSMPVEVRELL